MTTITHIVQPLRRYRDEADLRGHMPAERNR